MDGRLRLLRWLNVERDYTIAEKLYRIFKNEVESREPPNKIWLSDTVYCGRKKIFRMLGVGERFTEEQLNKIWLGIIVGKALEEIGIAKEVEVEYRGIRGRIDALLETGEPIEVKVIGNIYVASSNYADTHIEQLSRYCLASGKVAGIVFYYIPGMAMTNMPSYRYTFDLEAVRKETDERLDMLEKAYKALDPFILPPTWHSDSMDNWECRKCTYRGACRSGAKPI